MLKPENAAKFRTVTEILEQQLADGGLIGCEFPKPL